MAGKPHPEPDTVLSVAELKLRGHVVRLAVDSHARILFTDIYQYAHNGEVMLVDSGRLEGKALASLVGKLTPPTYPGNAARSPVALVAQACVERVAVDDEEDVYE